VETRTVKQHPYLWYNDITILGYSHGLGLGLRLGVLRLKLDVFQSVRSTASNFVLVNARSPIYPYNNKWHHGTEGTAD